MIRCTKCGRELVDDCPHWKPGACPKQGLPRVVYDIKMPPYRYQEPYTGISGSSIRLSSAGRFTIKAKG